MLIKAAARLTAFICAIILLYVGALHLRPYRYPPGFELIMPEPGCQSHCILGIEPGVTTVDEAIEILENHPAINEVVVHNNAFGGNEIRWKWEDQYNTPILQGAYPADRMTMDEDNLIKQIEATLPFTIFDYRMRYGTPKVISSMVSFNPDLRMATTASITEYFAEVQISYTYYCGLNLYDHIASISYPPPAQLPIPMSPLVEISATYGATPC